MYIHRMRFSASFPTPRRTASGEGKMVACVAMTVKCQTAISTAAVRSGNAMRSNLMRKADLREDFVAPFDVSRIAEIARMGDVDLDDALHAAGPRGQDHHAIGELHGFFDV